MFKKREEINLSRKKLGYHFYLFDKSRYFPVRQEICLLYPMVIKEIESFFFVVILVINLSYFFPVNKAGHNLPTSGT